MASLLLLGAPPMASHSLPLSPKLSFSISQSLIQSPITLSSTATSISTSSSTSTLPLIYCGKGDKKTARGKRFKHSFGNSRPKDKKKGRGPPRVYAPPLPPRKDPYIEEELDEFEIDEGETEIDESLF